MSQYFNEPLRYDEHDVTTLNSRNHGLTFLLPIVLRYRFVVVYVGVRCVVVVHACAELCIRRRPGAVGTQPHGGLSGKIVYTHGGHGITADEPDRRRSGPFSADPATE